MSERAKILVVDDDEHIREFFVAVLSVDDSYELATAADGEAAIRIIERQPPDLVLLDFMMPRFNGIDVLRNLKALAERDPRYEDVECIMITGKGDEGIAAAVVRAGAADYLSKPCPTERLLTTVDKVLEHRRLQMHRRREEKRRLRMRALLQRILELTIEGFVLTDLDGNVSFANAKAADILGWISPTDLREKTVAELMGTEVEALFQTYRSSGLQNEVGGPPLALTRRRQGQEVILSFTLHSFDDETGNPVGIIFRFQNMLEVKKNLDDSLSGASQEITRYFIPMHPASPKRRVLRKAPASTPPDPDEED